MRLTCLPQRSTKEFLAMMASRSEVARAVVNGPADEPELESKPQAGGGELAKEENGEEKDAATGDGPGALISSTTAGSSPTTAETTPTPCKIGIMPQRVAHFQAR